jgi:drug/metabolite transporter (DMT)-like permease
MNALLYGLVVVIWGTTWIAIFLQQGPVAAPVSIFWRFAVACAIMMIVLVALRRLRKLSLRDHLFCIIQGCCVFCFNFWCFYTAAAHITPGLSLSFSAWPCCITPSIALSSSASVHRHASGRQRLWG